MNNLNVRQDKIKKVRSNTYFREYIKEIASWYPMIYHRRGAIVSRYPETDRIKGVVGFNEFNEKSNEDLDFEVEYTGDFYKNLASLMKLIDWPSMIIYFGCENTPYSDIIMNSKNVYLSTSIINDCENILYSYNIKENSNNIFNCVTVIQDNDNIYHSTGVIQSYNIFYSKFIKNSNNLWFCSNMIGCSECIRCKGLENKSYCIDNKEYSKEEYNKLKVQSLKFKEKYMEWYCDLDEKGNNIGCENVDGSYMIDSEDVTNCYGSFNIKDGNNVIMRGGTKVNEHVYDMFTGGSVGNTHLYGITSAGANSDNLYCSIHIAGCSNMYYSIFMQNCSYCLGCIGLKNAEYCIFNKQYTKEEWYELADKIFEQLECDGLLGKYFPGSINPYYFKDTAAYLVDDTFTKEEVESQGYLRRDQEIKVDIPEGSEIISAVEGAAYMLPVTGTIADYQGFDEEGKWYIKPEILKKVIIDEKGNYYRIVKMEYDFLVKHGLPLPETHWLDRIKLGFKFN